MATHRRRFLRLCGVAGIGAIAGCSSGSQDTETPAGDEATATPTESGTPVQPPGGQAKLAADDGDGVDNFGYAVALSSDGTTAIIGARRDEDPNGDRSGSAYVFDSSEGSWTQQVKIVPDDGDSSDNFGTSVAVSMDGTTAVVGAPGDEDPNGDVAGSVYVFDGTGASWTQQAKLAADDGDEDDEFGSAVAVSNDGTTAVIGASWDEDPGGERSGSAYVFESSGGSWDQQAKLTADDTDSTDYFGDAVAVSDDGTTVIVGAYGDTNTNGDGAGSAYVFDNAGTAWSQQSRLAAADGDADDFFGDSVALSSDGTTAVIGARLDEDPNGYSAGSAYVFDTAGGSWSQQAKLTAENGGSSEWFGASVAVSGDGSTVLVGAHYDADPNGYTAGSAYLFDNASDSWSQQAKLTPDDGDSEDHFGFDVAVSRDGTTGLIGAYNDEDPNGESNADFVGTGAGSAYIFDL